MKTSLLLSSAVVALVAVSAHGQLVVYDFAGEPGNQASTPPTVTGSLIASSVFRGPGVTASAAGDSISASGWTTAVSIDATDYFGFSISPNSGLELNLTEIKFSERRSATGIRNWELRSSLDGYATAVASGTVPDDTNTRDQMVTLDSSFSGLDSTIEFRLYGFAAEGAGGTWRLSSSGDALGLQIFGAVVPEPHEYAALAGVGLLGFAAWRRSRRA